MDIRVVMTLPRSSLCKEAIEQGHQMLDSFVGYSFHAFETLPMQNQYLRLAEILDFRDKAFVTHHSNPHVIERIECKFGGRAVRNILDMLGVTLKRSVINDAEINFMSSKR